MLWGSIGQYFDEAVKTRGRSYYQNNRVRITDGDADFVEATVQGGHRYKVVISIEDDGLVVSCTCPHYEGGEYCKHIWATLLAADTKGLLTDVPDGCAVVLEDAGTDENGDWDDGPDDNEYLDDWEDAPRSRGLADMLASLAGSGRFGRGPDAGGPRRTPRQPNWKTMVRGLRSVMTDEDEPRRRPWPAGQELLYLLHRDRTIAAGAVCIDILSRRPKKTGGLTKPQSFAPGRTAEIGSVPDELDRQILMLMSGASRDPYGYHAVPGDRLSMPSLDLILPLLCRTGRFFPRGDRGELAGPPLRMDDGPAWAFGLEVVRHAERPEYVIRVALRRGVERTDLGEPYLLLAGGWVFGNGLVSRLEDFGAFTWIGFLRRFGELRVPVNQGGEFLAEALAAPAWPELHLPEELRFEEVALAPKPQLRIEKMKGWGMTDTLAAELSFDYEGTAVPAYPPGRGMFQADRRRVVRRDVEAERAASEKLQSLGFKAMTYAYGSYDKGTMQLRTARLPGAVSELVRCGWHVEAEGKLHRQPTSISVEVRSGVDWFELDGRADFDGASAELPKLLAALKKGENMVVLDDGSLGVLPEEWMKRWGMLAAIGHGEDGQVRFRHSQAALLDALLAEQGEVRCDEMFQRVRDELRAFEGVAAAEPPATFIGQLRPYQSDGLGWLHFLRRFGFGGCLADDMGLGKTIQALALLESRRELRAGAAEAERPGPSLVVVPRSLLFNWRQEAARFAPNLRVLEHTGIARPKTSDGFADADLVLTTYGTLRRDATFLKDVPFDYVILDEAQAVKNASTASSKAVRLLQGRHRLAMSGTPIENHLGELWSLIEFLNPGMLGSATAFQAGTRKGNGAGEAERAVLARALRPFILRRTKSQVAKDLPTRTEQTILCELQDEQRKDYDELRDHYRQALLATVDRQGIAKSKMHVLEALLRLRQAACHPGLIDKARKAESSAKLEALLPQLTEVLAEGHKALVFSQFTSFLSIVRDRLDAEKVPYAYLDGRTRDRQAAVDQFMTDPDCKLFLISLKAGGLGLNLTAAEYVFLLDPWWNPAVEAQAIDRTHRIGQTRQVFAYRLIARDTVEEKVLELQQSKRNLADAIINADNSLIRDLTREDLELLLG